MLEGLPQPPEEVELLPHVSVCVLLQLHAKCPGPLGTHQGHKEVVGVSHHLRGERLLQVPIPMALALREVEGLPYPPQSTCAVHPGCG